ncbi:MAG: T9SS type A sorting domain-containing protein [Candidatus Marinimicrobia bacterium]|nr:T9SS type A sorting domain-containing protein [Candidatus Neomarinimicrobiota bacterium]
MKKIATIFMVLALLSLAFADVNVTFMVNTSTSLDGATDSTCVMHVRGDMNSWGDGNPLTNVGGDYWETTIVLAAGTYGYKFTYTDNVTGGVKWEDNIGGNRSVTIGDADTVVALAYFDNLTGPYTATDSVDVWFRVSTAGIIGYAGETMNVRGGVAPLDWGTSIAFTQEDDSEFWSGLVSFPSTSIGTTAEYKFLQGDGWESLSANRSLVLGADTTLAFKYYSDTPPISEIDTFKVTIVMNTSTMDNITDSTALFFVTGSYDGWAHDDDTLKIVGDYCSKLFEFVGPSSGLDLEFTFFYRLLATIDQQSWEGISNHKPTVTSDTTLVYYWKNNETPPYTSTDSIDVWFRVNMAGVADYDGTSPVGVRGSIPLDPSWEHAEELTKEGDTDYYSGLISFPNADIGDTIQYKFVWGPLAGWDNVHWEAPKDDTFNGNRYFYLGSDTTLAFKYFSDEPPTGVEPQTAAVVFSVGMAAYLDLGLFSEARKDSMQVRGGFNGWNDGDPLKCKMTKQPGTSIYTLIAQITDFPDKEIEYKYYMKMSQESIDYWKTQGISDIVGDWGYEVPPTRGGGNRLLIFEGDPANYQILEVEAYNGLPLQGIIPAGTTVPVTFSIDMSAAPGFNSATDSVMFNFKDEWQVNALVLRDSVLEYTDDNSDGTYEITIDFFGPIAYTLIYTVSFAGPDGATEEGGGFEFGRFRCRYIQPATLDPVSWPAAHACPTDVFTEDPPLDVENPPLGVVKIDDEVVVPERFVLEQNFPNPFNPTTEIRFSIQRSDNVTLTVYNMLGQMVTKAVYNNLQVGQYTYMWNGTDMHGNSVASGVYFYELQAGNQFRDIKKMVLMK